MLRAWCKTIVTTSFYIRSYNSFASSPRIVYRIHVCDISHVSRQPDIEQAPPEADDRGQDCPATRRTDGETGVQTDQGEGGMC